MRKTMIGLILLLLSASPNGFAAPSWTYQVEGVGAIVSENQAAARQQAVRAALRAALEEAVLSVLDTDAVVANIHLLNERLYAEPWPYISSYRVLWEYPDAPGQALPRPPGGRSHLAKGAAGAGDVGFVGCYG